MEGDFINFRLKPKKKENLRCWTYCREKAFPAISRQWTTDWNHWVQELTKLFFLHWRIFSPSFHKFSRNQVRQGANKFLTPAKNILWTLLLTFGGTFRQHFSVNWIENCEDNIWSIWTKMFAILTLYQRTLEPRTVVQNGLVFSQHIFFKTCMKKKRGSFDTLTFKNCVRLRNLVKKMQS